MSVPHLLTDTLLTQLSQATVLPAQDIPNPGPQAPPGAGAIENVVSYVRWIAGICILGLFFGGIVAATAGRLWDHHGSGRLGARMIVGSLALAVLFGLGYTLVSQFAASAA
ncbi:hypothetical protein AD006_32245 (plasmid) [Pseudonocardia sp. EC080610-09]|uniref:hypothetical protein n=1 Tax=Pseudonocardia sp. EC080610-09 TaxID=1688404 RepID=UPI000705EC8B|nr:hypothetical protein [Pseudonocardia sp. EC080610-09]ALL79915.1 hypothetical protein AD006_32245 [Pseudonocardia sp. EC080610-09]